MNSEIKDNIKNNMNILLQGGNNILNNIKGRVANGLVRSCVDTAF
jgi:hypothetical protein